MWRSPASRLALRALLPISGSSAGRSSGVDRRIRPWRASPRLSSSAAPGAASPAPAEGPPMSSYEVKRLMRLVDVDALKRKLGTGGKEVIGYDDLLEACESVAAPCGSREEAVDLARSLDEAGVVLLFQDKVYLHPDKVVDAVRRSLPLALTTKSDPRKEELKQLQKKKEEIDMMAQKQVRRVLWSGLGFLVLQTGVFFRLTFWDFSWDVMEPITFFCTTTGLLVGYSYFLFTSRDPSYQDMMRRLFLSRHRRLSQKHHFDARRLAELQKHCHCPDVDHEGTDQLHRDY